MCMRQYSSPLGLPDYFVQSVYLPFDCQLDVSFFLSWTYGWKCVIENEN